MSTVPGLLGYTHGWLLVHTSTTDLEAVDEEQDIRGTLPHRHPVEGDRAVRPAAAGVISVHGIAASTRASVLVGQEQRPLDEHWEFLHSGAERIPCRHLWRLERATTEGGGGGH